MSKPKQCPVCREYLSEDYNTFYCDYCDFEQVKIYKPKYKEEL